MYAALSQYYDGFMRDVDYARWLDYIVGFLPDKSEGIDFACGSGKFTVGLIKKGYTVCGVDNSRNMLSKARDNAQNAGVRALFLCGDYRTFAPIKPVSFMTCMCDGLNYVPDPLVAFKNFYAHLSDGGKIIFDVSSAYKLRTVLANNTFYNEAETVSYTWKNRFKQAPPRVEMNLFFYETNGGGTVKKTERQTQYVHTQEDLERDLQAAGFVLEGVYADMTHTAPKKDTQRIHFVAKK